MNGRNILFWKIEVLEKRSPLIPQTVLALKGSWRSKIRCWYEDQGLRTRMWVIRSSYQDLGVKFLAPRIWYQDPGTKILVPESWYWILVPDLDIYQILPPGSWYRDLGTKMLVPRAITVKSKIFFLVLPWNILATHCCTIFKASNFKKMDF